MIEAEVSLIQEALSFGNYDRYVLLPDDCVPLRSASRIIKELSREGEWISAAPISNPAVTARYEKFYMYDLPALSPKHLPNSERGVDQSQMAELLQFAAAIARGKKPLEKLYYGSQWWALSQESINKFLNAYFSDELLRTSFRYSAIPDEHYIQTVLGTFSTGTKFLGCPVYADFRRDPKPYVFHTEGDLAEPLNSEMLFVRKIKADADKLLDFIKNYSNSQNQDD